MARRKGVDTQIGVTRGFVTEFTPLSFPREAAIDVDNCVMDKDGSVRRRPGIDLEQGFKLNTVAGAQLTATALTEITFSTHLWEFVSNSGTLNIVVVQSGATLQFFAQFGAVSANLLGTLDLGPFAVDLSKLRREPIVIASGLGNLYIVNPYMEPLRVSYDGITFDATPINIRIRDTEGLEDGLEIDQRPGVLFRNHYYNLRNQGWTDANIKEFGGVDASVDLCARSGDVGGLPAGGVGEFDAAAATVICEAQGLSGLALVACVLVAASEFAGGTGIWPSNSDNMNVGIVSNQDGNLEFDPNFIINDNFGNTPQAKGHFILNAFAKDYDDALDCVGTSQAFFPRRPEAVAFHQGRAFFTTANLANSIGGVFYSQQLVKPDLDGECFQEADPTAAEINDLIDTDGGFLPMPGVGQIYSLNEVGNGLAVIASNGVWYITGGDISSGITATSLRLDKISKLGAMGPSNIVEAEGSVFFWGIDGIIQLQVGDNFGLTATNITNESIQSFYIVIPAVARREASAVYIAEERKIYWAYREEIEGVTPSLISKNKFLILDFDVGGFYKYSIAESAAQTFPEIVGLTFVKPLASQSALVPVLELNGDIVTELNGDPVEEAIVQDTGQISQMKMATMAFSTVNQSYQVTFATFHSRSFTDWRELEVVGVGLPMTSFVEFAEFNMAAAHTKGVANYVHSFFQQTSKNLAPGGYWELPPLFYVSQGLRLGQSVLEVLNKPSSNLRLSQSVMEVLLTSPSDFRLSQSVLEVLYDV